MEYYIGNRGDERKWNKRTESSRSTNVKSSLLGCLVVRGSASSEHGRSLFPPHSIPFHSRPGKREIFWGGGRSLSYIHAYVYVWVKKKKNHNCMFELQATGFYRSIVYLWYSTSTYLHRKRMLQEQQGCWVVETTSVVCSGLGPGGLGAWRSGGLEVWGPGGLGAWRSRGRGLGLGLGASAGQWQWMSSLAVRMLSFVLQVLVVSDGGHYCCQASKSAYGDCCDISIAFLVEKILRSWRCSNSHLPVF